MTGVQRARPFAALLVVCLIGILTPAGVDAQVRGYLYASVLDRSGEPVLDLTVDDFMVSVGGTEIPMVSCELDSHPLKIALMLDNGNVMSEANADSEVREALAAFLDTLAPQHEVGFFTIARNVLRRAAFTTDREALKAQTGEVFSDKGAGARMMQGLFEIWERDFDPEDSWPVFVLILTDGAELSDFISDDEYNGFVNDLIQRGANVHVVLFTRQGSLNRLGGVQTQYSLNMTENTGGIYRNINTPTGLSRVLTEFANQLNAQFDEASNRYRLLIEIPENLRASGIAVDVAREDVNLQLFPDRRLSQ